MSKAKKTTQKVLSNPASTGGLGFYFESRVQASFVVLMLTGGFAPYLPLWPITKIKFQGKYQGYDTDDLIVFANEPNSSRQAKLLGQIKRFVSISNNQVFREVIQAAWNDFNNPKVFSKETDIIALITGPLSSGDSTATRELLKQAESAENSVDFFNKVGLAKFTSNKQRKKLSVFRDCLKIANNAVEIPDEKLWQFLKIYRLLIYDLDINGVTLSLLRSLIGQYALANADAIWAQLADITGWANHNAGVVTIETIPDSIRTVFSKRAPAAAPAGLAQSFLIGKTDWGHIPHAAELAIVNLLGSWNESSKADQAIIEKIAKESFNSWIYKMREVLQLQNSPLCLKNGIWTIANHLETWKSLGSRLFDEHLDLFKTGIVTVLKERDPRFDLKPEDRFAANIYGKVLKHSPHMREGLAKSLAILGNNASELKNCSLGKAEATAVVAVREIFEDADWSLWGSLNNLLPFLAEAAPDVFLEAVELALQKDPCPFDTLFAQEHSGVFGGSYLTGLLWALEALAWDEQYLGRVTLILGDLASHDPGGNIANRPSNSLSTIFLPMAPQTMASFEKRKAAIKSLENENPDVAWKLLLRLLPRQGQFSLGSSKPRWHKPVPADWKKVATGEEYWEQVSFYADFSVETAKSDTSKIKDLVSHLDHLTAPSLDEMLRHLSSTEVIGLPESERRDIWEKLLEFTTKHKKFSDAKWAVDSDVIEKIDNIAKFLEPKNPLNLYHRLFSKSSFDLFYEKEDWQTQEKKLAEYRQKAIREIFSSGGMEAIINFYKIVEFPEAVGAALGFIDDRAIDSAVLPKMLESDQTTLQFVRGFVWARFRNNGWDWANKVDVDSWTAQQIGQFLAYLPFKQETWKRVETLLGKDESEYWKVVSVNPYSSSKEELSIAIDKLTEHNRSYSAVACISRLVHEKEQLSVPQAVRTLMSTASSIESAGTTHAYDLVEIIKILQDAPDISEDDLFRIEWAYLPLLDEHNGGTPKYLENRLASDPSFFCEVVRVIYRSDKEPKVQKETDKSKQAIALNAYNLLKDWKTLPGMQKDGVFLKDKFREWLALVKKECKESGHLGVALSSIGHVLLYAPTDPDGLWMDRAIADALNAKDMDKMRRGYSMAVFNSRGVHWVDPTGKPELDLAKKYDQKAEEIESAGYPRFAATLRMIAESFIRDAKRVVDEHKKEEVEDKEETE